MGRFFRFRFFTASRSSSALLFIVFMVFCSGLELKFCPTGYLLLRGACRFPCVAGFRQEGCSCRNVRNGSSHPLPGRCGLATQLTCDAQEFERDIVSEAGGSDTEEGDTAAAAAAGGGSSRSVRRRHRSTSSSSGKTLTLAFVSDDHFGRPGGDTRYNVDRVHALNQLDLLGHWPDAVGGGDVQSPLAVVLVGDFTESGRIEDWAAGLSLYDPAWRAVSDGLLAAAAAAPLQTTTTTTAAAAAVRSSSSGLIVQPERSLDGEALPANGIRSALRRAYGKTSGAAAAEAGDERGMAAAASAAGSDDKHEASTSPAAPRLVPSRLTTVNPETVRLPVLPSLAAHDLHTRLTESINSMRAALSPECSEKHESIFSRLPRGMLSALHLSSASYSFTAGGIHFIISGWVHRRHHEPSQSGTSLPFLLRELRRAKDASVPAVLLLHDPFEVSNNPRLTTALANSTVIAVIGGHIHDPPFNHVADVAGRPILKTGFSQVGNVGLLVEFDAGSGNAGGTFRSAAVMQRDGVPSWGAAASFSFSWMNRRRAPLRQRQVRVRKEAPSAPRRHPVGTAGLNNLTK